MATTSRAVRAQRLQHWRNLAIEHRDIAGDDGFGVAAVEAAQVFSPMRALIVAPISFSEMSGRPMVIL